MEKRVCPVITLPTQELWGVLTVSSHYSSNTELWGVLTVCPVITPPTQELWGVRTVSDKTALRKILKGKTRMLMESTAPIAGNAYIPGH